MKVSTSMGIAFILMDKAQKKYFDFTTSSTDSKTLYDYANYLLKIVDQNERRDLASYLYYLYNNSANNDAAIKAFQKTISDQNFDQYKLWMDVGFFFNFHIYLKNN